MQKTKEHSVKDTVFISDEERATLSRKAFGRNVLAQKKRKSFFRIFIKNLGDPVIRILLFALALNVAFMLRGKDWHEGAGIALSVVCATLISSISEYKRDSAYERLSVSAIGNYKVLRGEGYVLLPSDELTVGDIVELSAGERIPADCIILSGSVKADQAPLTGESEEVEKSADGRVSSKILSLLSRFFSGEDVSDKIDALSGEITPDSPFALLGGCHVSFGCAVAVIYAVGDRTRLGRISDSLAGEDEKSPLRERLDILARQISRIGYVSSALIALAYLFNIFVIESSFSRIIMLAKLSDIRFVFTSLLGAFTVALTVIVMAVPEGLPMMIAVVLSRNAGKMARDNVLVRHAPGIEAAGCMNVLFTDKTGTLTMGKPSVCAVITQSGEYKSCKDFSRKESFAFEMLSLCAQYNTSACFDASGVPIGGNTAERVLLSFVMRSGRLGAKRLAYSPFDSVKKQSSATVSYNGRIYELYKGAPEILLSRAEYALDESGRVVPLDRYAFEAKIRAHSSAGERLILCAFSYPSSSLCVICAAAMKDPIRPEAKSAVSDLKGAGIHVVMITGDGRQTAEKIASDCKILTPLTPLSLSGDDVTRMSDAELSECLDRLAVVYRALPEHKERLVKISKGKNYTCGMTGDGLNDAPALKSADCGFALGCGSEVSKDAADIIILDDNLASVVNAVLHGRNIFCSIRKFITLQLIMNFTAMAISMIGPFIGIENPITVVQMLWINIVMDTLGGLAFAGEHADRRLLRDKPKRRDEPVLNRTTVGKVARLSLFSCALCVFFLRSRAVLSYLCCAEGSAYHLTAFFALFIFSSALNCFNARSDRLNMLSGISKNPTFIAIISLVAVIQAFFIYFGSSVMRTVPLSLPHLLFTVLLALPVVIFELLAKVYVRLSARRE